MTRGEAQELFELVSDAERLLYKAKQKEAKMVVAYPRVSILHEEVERIEQELFNMARQT